jgi:hypothetical protein
MDYYSYIERPPLDAFALQHAPRPELAKMVVTWWMQVTGESGNAYNLIRAIGMPTKDVIRSFGALRGSGNIDVRADPFVAHAELPPAEPFWTETRADAIVYCGSSFEITMTADGYRWLDASGRIDLTAERLGDACSVWIPPQPGCAPGFLDRSHLCIVAGTIDGDPVRGTFMDDHLYSAPGATMRDVGFAGTIENYWTHWLVEYDDGSLEGGAAWRGDPATGFTHAHHYVDGHSRARRDGTINIERNAHGSMTQLTLAFPEATFTFAQDGSYDWPFHTYGRLVCSSRDKTVARSWQYIENWPTNMNAIDDYQTAYAHLYGRGYSMRRLIDGARFKDETLILTPPTHAPGT